MDDNKHISFQLSICSDQGLSGNATHATGNILLLKDLGRCILQCTDIYYHCTSIVKIQLNSAEKQNSGKLLTEKESKWAPNQLEHSRYFPHQNNHKKARNDFCSNDLAHLIILVQNAKRPINHKSEKSVHGAYVVQHVTVVEDDTAT